MSKTNSPKLWQPGMWALALGIIALPATLQAQDKPAETEMIIIKDQFSLTLNDAVRIALEKSPTLQATLLGIDGARADVVPYYAKNSPFFAICIFV